MRYTPHFIQITCLGILLAAVTTHADYVDSEIRIYVDGQKVLQETVDFNSTTYDPGPTKTHRDQIGRGAGGESGHFHGLLDEVAVYSRALD